MGEVLLLKGEVLSSSMDLEYRVYNTDINLEPSLIHCVDIDQRGGLLKTVWVDDRGSWRRLSKILTN